MSEVESRHLAEYLADPYYCPENQATGCRGCQGEDDCLIRIHEEGLCWKLEIFEPCEICEKIKENENA